MDVQPQSGGEGGRGLPFPGQDPGGPGGPGTALSQTLNDKRTNIHSLHLSPPFMASHPATVSSVPGTLLGSPIQAK